MADGFSLTCTKVIPQLSIQFGDYTLIGDFYVINLNNLDFFWDWSGWNHLNVLFKTLDKCNYSLW